MRSCATSWIRGAAPPSNVNPHTLDQSYEELCHFVDTVHKGGCNTFIVHARIAILKGLSPKEVPYLNLKPCILNPKP